MTHTLKEIEALIDVYGIAENVTGGEHYADVDSAKAALLSAIRAVVERPVSLPFITPDLIEMFVDTPLMERNTHGGGYDWTQLAVDFVAALSPPPVGEQK